MAGRRLIAALAQEPKSPAFTPGFFVARTGAKQAA
jgi:hypothetical protein